MSVSRNVVAVLGGVAGFAVGAAVLVSGWGSRPEPAPAPGEPPPGEIKPIPVRPDSEAPYRPYDYHLTTNQAVRVFEDRVKADPQNFFHLTQLGILYIQQAREKGDHAAYDKADDAFRRALKLAPAYAPAQLGIALTASARHKFAEGLKLAEKVYKDNPDLLEALAAVADGHLELGNYPEAEAAVAELGKKAPPPHPPAVLVRQARVAELRGQLDVAVGLFRQALDTKRAEHDFKNASAWFAMRLGEVLLARGQLDEAAGHFEAALKDSPDFPAAITLLGKARRAQGKTAEAKQLFARSLRITPDLPALIDLADLHAAAGEDVPAKAYFAEVEKADNNPLATRDLVLYYCDHDRKLPRALELAEAEAKARNDVYTADSLAWARFKNGKLADAEKASADALRLGTRDALLLFHAGVIAHAAGKPDAARDHLKKALEVNPHFSEKYAAEARKLLATLDAKPK